MVTIAIALSLAASSAHAAPMAPNERAYWIARDAARPRRQAVNLRGEARRIDGRALRRAAEAALDGRLLDPLLALRAKEDELASELRLKGFLEAGARVFPPGEPMRFEASAGGVRSGHHAYPGGLVDHTLLNVRAGLGWTRAYRRTYGVHLDDGLVRAAAILHDAAKTWTLPWSEDGVVPEKEPQIAGTGAHHVLGVAAALAAGWPPRAVVTLASAHAPPKPGRDLDALLGYLRAAAVIAGKPYAAAGLTEDGKALLAPAPVEAFVNHLGDHDYVLSETVLGAVRAALPGAAGWDLARRLAEDGELPLYRKLLDKPAR